MSRRRKHGSSRPPIDFAPCAQNQKRLHIGLESVLGRLYLPIRTDIEHCDTKNNNGCSLHSHLCERARTIQLQSKILKQRLEYVVQYTSGM